MTEENKDANPPKIRLSRKPTDDETEEAAASKQDLNLKRPAEEEPQMDADEAKTASPNTLDTPSREPEEPLTKEEITDEQAFDPKKPFKGIVEEPKVENRDDLPPELPSKPAPTPNDGSTEKLEESISQIGEEEEEQSKGGLLTSIVIIFILIAILGGSGYGLYYVLKEPAESSDSAPDSTTESNPPEEESGGFISGAIAKAKDAVNKKTDNDASVEEVFSPQNSVESESAPVSEDLASLASETKKEPEAALPAALPAAKSAATSSIADFLQDAHIGGVRTGDRPMLIMNGKSYNQGDLIDPENGLRFIGFRDEKLAFRDTEGIIYVKSF